MGTIAITEDGFYCTYKLYVAEGVDLKWILEIPHCQRKRHSFLTLEHVI